MGLGAFEDGYYMGIPSDVTWSEDSEGHIIAYPIVNQVDAAIERAREKYKDAPEGTRFQPVDLRVNPEYEKYAD